MSKKYDLSLVLDEETEKMLRDGEYLGEGNNGIVFLLPGRKIIKIFYDKKTCLKEALILKKVNGSVYFPKMIKHGSKYIVRELVEGTRLDIYLKDHELTEKLTRKIYKLLKEFRKLKFTKLDIRCRDVYVDKNKNLKIIDPRGSFTRNKSYPRHLMKGLKNIGVLDKFLENMMNIDKESGISWREQFDKYTRLGIK